METVEREIRLIRVLTFPPNLRREVFQGRAETGLGDNVVLHQVAGVEREVV